MASYGQSTTSSTRATRRAVSSVNGTQRVTRGLHESERRANNRARRGAANNRRSKRWCFTINNPTEEDLLGLISIGEDQELCSYLIFAEEKGESGTRHYQGYVEFVERVRFNTAKGHISERCHLEVARGTPEENIKYCSKEGQPAIYGTPAYRGSQGKRSDLLEVQQKIREGATEREIADNYFTKWVIYRRSFETYRSLLAQPRTYKSYTTVYFGRTGVGKTRRVHEQENPADLYTLVDTTGKWFDGYTGQTAVLIDDFASGIEFRFLLRLLDRYPMQVPVKGGFTNWIPARIYITSNLSPTDWYPMMSESLKEPLYRRLDNVVEMTELIE